MFARHHMTPDTMACLDQIEHWVRTRYSVDEDQLVLASEENGRVPGYPARMTTVLFWLADGTRHRIRVFKPAVEVAENDLPASWLRSALRDEGESDCC
jgi:hypothetical protein